MLTGRVRGTLQTCTLPHYARGLSYYDMSLLPLRKHPIRNMVTHWTTPSVSTINIDLVGLLKLLSALTKGYHLTLYDIK